ncbi:MAG: Ig-like domain-containing protein [Lachnospira sp.]|nr:Ig-like domain-containing protein [Lachnospira sp.]
MMRFDMKKRMLAVLLAMTMVLSTAFSGVTTTNAASNKKVKSVTVKIGSKKVTKKTYSLKKGKSANLKVTVKPKAAKKTIAYKTSKKAVATVSRKGKVTAKKAGTAKITITVTGKDKKKMKTWVKIKVTNGATTAQPATTVAQPTTADPNATTQAPVPAKKELNVTKVSAIDTKTGEVTLTFDSKVTADDLTGTVITISDGSGTIVSASFKEVSADGNSATYLIAASDLSKITTGNYTISSASGNINIPATIGQSTATVQITGSSVKGLVYYDDILGYTAIKGASITIDGKTTKSDAKGFYQQSANPADYPLITVKADGFFDESKTNVKVASNTASAYNFEMEKYDISKIYICGTVTDSEDNSKPVAGATVVLYENGEVKATVETDTKGHYLFRNYRSTVTNFTTDSSKSTKIFYSDNLILQENTYEIAVSKELGAENIKDVYKAVPAQRISLGSARNVNVSTRLTKVKELDEITLDLNWSQEENNEAVLKSAGSTKVQVSFVTKANEVLASKSIDLGEYLTTTYNKMARGYRMAANDFFNTGSANVKPTLPTDTYYLVVKDLADDSTQQNSTLVIPVSLTEGGDAKVGGTFTKALSRNVIYSAALSDEYKAISEKNQGATLKYVTDAAGSLGSNIVIDTNIYEKVGDDRVLISTQQGITLEKSGSNTSYGANKACDFLGKDKDYIVETMKSHLTKPDVAVSTKTAGNWNVELGGAVNIVKVKADNIANFKDQYGTNNTASGTDSVTLNAVTVTSGSKTHTVEINRKYTLSQLVSGIPIDDEAFRGLTPGKYTISFDIAEYQQSNRDSEKDEQQDLIDLQNATVISEATYNRVYPTTVKGVVAYGDIADNKAQLTGEGIAVLYNEDRSRIVAADTLTKSDGIVSYSLEDGIDGTFGAGKYVLVVRAAGIDTQIKDITIAGANTVVSNQNFENLTVGGNSTIKTLVTTSTGAALDSTAYIMAFDEYYIDPLSEKVDELAALILRGSGYDGSFRVLRKGEETYESVSVSAGKYNVIITSDTTETMEKSVTVAGTQAEEIKVAPRHYDNLVRINLRLNNYNDSTYKNGQIDYVVAESADGTVSYDGVFVRSKQKEDTGYFMVPKNRAYTIRVYSNDTKVGEQTIASQSEEDSTVSVNCEKIN